MRLAMRISAALRETAGMPPTDAVDQIMARVRKWSASQLDDWTVVMCDYQGAGVN
jgi:hypothetical protein